jgi:NAD(P)-dependent dehydrogenase (short-subunit alcohol dehydrogenase family)
MQDRSLFITGIHRGLGKATALLAVRRGYAVVGSVRREEDLIDVAAWQSDLASEGAPGSLQGVLLDVLDIDNMPTSTRLALEASDVLVNNAGWGAEIDIQSRMTDLVDRMDEDIFARAVAINAEGPRKLMAIALPKMKQRGWGRIVNVSSARACISEIIGADSIPAYRLSKLLLNGITALAGHENANTGVLVNSLCPGWCKTDMGGPQAVDTPEEGAHRILALAEVEDDGPTGLFFIDGKPFRF